MYKYHLVSLMIFILSMSLLLTGHEIFVTSRQCHWKAFNNSDLLGLKGFQTFSQLHIGRLRKSPPACKQDRKIKERDVKDRVMGCPSIYMNVNTYWIYIYMNISNRFLFNLYWYLLRCNILCFQSFLFASPTFGLELPILRNAAGEGSTETTLKVLGRNS